MKILLIDSNEPINNRNIKIIDSLNNFNDIEIILATWKRKSGIEIEYNVSKKFLFKKLSKLGARLRKTLNLISYYKFLKNINIDEKPNFIIASHYDMLLLASFIKMRNQYLVYENLDIPTSYNPFILKILKFVEKIALKSTDYIIHASRFYPQLYNHFVKEQQVLENIPNLKVNSDHFYKNNCNKIVISFIGGIRYIDILIRLINESLNFKNIEIRLHGEGHESEKLNEYIKLNNIEDLVKVGGKYNYDSIDKLYLESDFIWSVYPNNNYNVKYAISNKFHESLFFSIPGIYASNTLLGDLVAENSIGLTVDPYSSEDIYNLLYRISNQDIDVASFKFNISEFQRIHFTTWEDGINHFVSWMEGRGR